MRSLRIALSALFVLCAAHTAEAATANDARAFTDQIGNNVLAVIADTHLSEAEKQTRLKAMFAENVDIPWVGRFVLGRFWRQATPEQRERYLREYQEFLITHYTSRFSDYSGGGFTITGAQDEGDGKFIVSMEISGSNGQPPVLADYRIRASEDGTLKVYDIIVEGVSMITTQRSEFSSIVSNRGLDYLIEQLAAKKITPPAELPHP